MAKERLLVVGGSGFLGGAVCRAALRRGWQVASLSPGGGGGHDHDQDHNHNPHHHWTSQVEWHAGDVMQRETLERVLGQGDFSAVVHTVGILLEKTEYKRAGGMALVGGVLESWRRRSGLESIAKDFRTAYGLGDTSAKGNPLADKDKVGEEEEQQDSHPTYERMNRDTALQVAQAFARVSASRPDSSRTLAYISAQDVFGSLIDPRYISTKREAERGIAEIARGHGDGERTFRSLYIRPGFMYHPETRPTSTLPAAVLDLSSRLSARAPTGLTTLVQGLALTSTPMGQVARSIEGLTRVLRAPPIHVETVAKAICNAIEDPSCAGPYEMDGLRKLAERVAPPAQRETVTSVIQDYQDGMQHPPSSSAGREHKPYVQPVRSFSTSTRRRRPAQAERKSDDDGLPAFPQLKAGPGSRTPGSSIVAHATWTMSDVTPMTISHLLAANAHVGHSTTLWRPTTSQFIFGKRAGIHIIDLDQTVVRLRRAAKVVNDVVRRDGLVVFIGTRPGQRSIVLEAAKRLGENGYHIAENEKWVPGTISNAARIQNVDEHTARQFLPDLLVVLNPLENRIALAEAAAARVPTIGIIDTDADPRMVSFPIPANDDSLRSTGLIANLLSVAGQDGAEERRVQVREAKDAIEKSQSERRRGHLPRRGQ